MAGIVGSAVASEAVSRISTFLSGGKTGHESAEVKAERLEMAVLKIRSIVAISEGQHISHLPLLRWRAKLNRVAEEGDDLLRAHEERRDRASDGGAAGSSIPRILIQAARRFVPLRREGDEPSSLDDATLRRFERLADGADSFFRLVESGGHPRRPMFLPSLARSLLAGDSMEFSIRRRGGGSDLVLLWPWLDRGTADGSEACLVVSHEDEAMWHKNLKMSIMFRLSEASDILAIAVSCLDLLPPQFDAASRDIRRLLTETIGQRGDHSSLSEGSMWCCRHIQSHYQNDHGSADKHRSRGILLPAPVLQLTVSCYASPSTGGSSSSPKKDGLPLELVCHVSPYPLPLPEKHFSQLELAEQDAIRKLLPEVTDGCYDDRREALDCKRQIWCPESSMYCMVGRAVSQPLTISQKCRMESSGAHGKRRRKRRTRTEFQSVSESQKIAKSY